jgi:hypothetical protein
MGMFYAIGLLVGVNESFGPNALLPGSQYWSEEITSPMGLWFMQCMGALTLIAGNLPALLDRTSKTGHRQVIVTGPMVAVLEIFGAHTLPTAAPKATWYGTSVLFLLLTVGVLATEDWSNGDDAGSRLSRPNPFRTCAVCMMFFYGVALLINVNTFFAKSAFFSILQYWNNDGGPIAQWCARFVGVLFLGASLPLLRLDRTSSLAARQMLLQSIFSTIVAIVAVTGPTYKFAAEPKWIWYATAALFGVLALGMLATDNWRGDAKARKPIEEDVDDELLEME